MSFIYLECSNPDCLFRFPAAEERRHDCPVCHSPTRRAAAVVQTTHIPRRAPDTLRVEGFLDNIRSAYNVGSIFRTADGCGIHHLHLCGITTTPDHPRIPKTSLGAEQAIPWTYHRNSLTAARMLKDRGCLLWALENQPGSDSLLPPSFPPPKSGETLVLIVGNEKAGIDPGLSALCDRIISIPMLGQKESLNVAVAFGIAAYLVRFSL
jgi:tRNA G18 (ribose-2'-O)-methylase SpoU